MSIAIAILIYLIVAGLILTGLVGIFFPGIPGAPLIFLGMLIYGIYSSFSNISLWSYLLLLILTILLSLIDYLSSSVGTKQAGGSRWGIIGALAGSLIGFALGSILGLIIGPIIGAVLLEIIVEGKTIKAALKAGGGAALGLFGGTLAKAVLAIIMISLFLAAIFF